MLTCSPSRSRILIIGDTFYCNNVDLILFQCLSHKEEERIFNDFQSEVCSGHLSRMEINYKILCTLIFKYYNQVIKKCNPCQVIKKKMHAHPTLLHLFMNNDPFENGVLISCNVIQFPWEAISTLLWPCITLQSG